MFKFHTYHWPSIRREWAKVVQADPQIPPPRLTAPVDLSTDCRGVPLSAAEESRLRLEIEQQAKRQAR